jgi:hypothetical protein
MSVTEVGSVGFVLTTVLKAEGICGVMLRSLPVAVLP